MSEGLYDPHIQNESGKIDTVMYISTEKRFSARKDFPHELFFAKNGGAAIVYELPKN